MSAGQRTEVVARVMTGVIGIPAVLALILRGGPVFLGVLAAGALTMLWEYRRLVAAGGNAPSLALLWAAGLGAGLLVLRGGEDAAIAWVFGVLLVELAVGLREAPEKSLLRRGGALVLGALYIGVPVGVMGRLWLQSPWLLIAGFALIWADDILAYVVGVNFGRRRLAPRLSPKKSVEGAIGGLVGAVAVAAAVSPWLGLGRGAAAGVGLAVAVAAQVGDLVESALKREAGLKDSGRLLPGHGGLLDRFDSSLFALPVLYVLILALR